MQVFTAPQFAQRLTTSLFADGISRIMSPGAGGITVNLTDLDMTEQALARGAMAEIATVTGLRFVETTGEAQIVYLDDGPGAYTEVTASGTTITRATVNIAASRVTPTDGPGTFAFRTYMHETMHALGLGHPQDYAQIRDYAQSEIANDSWQISLMSYFDQDENTSVTGSKAYNLTPAIADYLALRQLYGTPAVHAGDTTYGVGSTAGGALDGLAGSAGLAMSLIADHGGDDLLDLSTADGPQRIDLTPGALSDVLGGVGNLHIAFDTVIERATGGAGDDQIGGNAAANVLDGGAGDDTLDGGEASDTMIGGSGDDVFRVDAPGDRVVEAAGGGSDRLVASISVDLSDARGIYAQVEHVTLSGGGATAALGSAEANRLEGDDSANRLAGRGGNDTLLGGAGDDRLSGGTGGDWIHGGWADSFSFAVMGDRWPADPSDPGGASEMIDPWPPALALGHLSPTADAARWGGDPLRVADRASVSVTSTMPAAEPWLGDTIL